MHDQAAQRAIKSALSGNWDEAIEFNLQALKTNPTDTDTLNRLARAYAAIGQTKNAQKVWHKVLHIDPYNAIATQQLTKLKHRHSTDNLANKPPLSANTFVDEPGKTKTTVLCRLANTSILSNLEPGESVNLFLKKRSIEITTTSGEYLGSLPDSLSLYLIKRIKGGNKYEATIRRVDKNSVHVFLKETKRAKKYQHLPSFLNHAAPLELESFTTINESPIDVLPTGEDVDQS